MKLFLMISCFIHRSVPSTIVFRGQSLRTIAKRQAEPEEPHRIYREMIVKDREVEETTQTWPTN